jgi:transposase
MAAVTLAPVTSSAVARAASTRWRYWRGVMPSLARKVRARLAAVIPTARATSAMRTPSSSLARSAQASLMARAGSEAARPA